MPFVITPDDAVGSRGAATPLRAVDAAGAAVAGEIGGLAGGRTQGKVVTAGAINANGL